MHLHHLALGATQVDQLSTFYARVFSLNERSRQSDEKGLRSIWLELDPGILMIERTDDSVDWKEQMRRGLFLIAFKVSQSRREIIEKAVVESGGKVESRTEFTTYFRDPEHNRVAISTHSLHL